MVVKILQKLRDQNPDCQIVLIYSPIKSILVLTVVCKGVRQCARSQVIFYLISDVKEAICTKWKLSAIALLDNWS